MFSLEMTKSEFISDFNSERKKSEFEIHIAAFNNNINSIRKKFIKTNKEKYRKKLEEKLESINRDIFSYRSDIDAIYYKSDFENYGECLSDDCNVAKILVDISNKYPDSIFVYLWIISKEDEFAELGEAWIVALMPDAMTAYEFRKQYADCNLRIV